MDDQAAAGLRRQYETIFRYVRRRTSSREDAEDLTQEVFQAAIEALTQARIDATSPPLAWLYTVARRRLIDRLRTSAVSVVTLDDEGLIGADADRPYGPMIVTAILEALNTLSDDQRSVVILKVFEGRSFAEIATTVGASEEACRMRLSRGLAQLRKELEQKGANP